jgi:hypothetical protein
MSQKFKKTGLKNKVSRKRGSFCFLLAIGLWCFVLQPFSLSIPKEAHAAQITLAWDNSDGATGYRIYYGTVNRNYTSVVDVGNVTTYTFANLLNGVTYYFAATAYDASGNESDYSEEITYNNATTPTSYTISASAGTGGTISPSGGVSVSGGSSRTFTITPNSGYRISNVTVDGVSMGFISSYSFYNVTSNHTISATFAKITYELNVTRTGTGTVTANPAGTSFNAGTTVTLTAAAGTGYTFSGWSGACSGMSSTCQVTMNNDTSVSAAFTLRSYMISSLAGTGGTISPSGNVSVTYGSNQTFTITPETGYAINNVSIDGNSVGAVSSHTFSNITATHTISATFNVLTNSNQAQILWRNASTGANMVWYMNGATVISTAALLTVSDTNWEIRGVADFNSDGEPDILWRNASTGTNAVWYMNGVTKKSTTALIKVTDTNWEVVGATN